MVLNASWTPRYDVRVENDAQRLTLVYMAEIRQSTEEAWEDVQMVLSTAQPALGGDAPELGTWTVQLQPSFMRNYKKSGSAMSSSAMGRSNDALAAPAAGSMANLSRSMSYRGGTLGKFGMAEEDTDSRDSGGNQYYNKGSVSSMSYEIPARANIPSDNVPHKVTGKY